MYFSILANEPNIVHDEIMAFAKIFVKTILPYFGKKQNLHMEVNCEKMEKESTFGTMEISYLNLNYLILSGLSRILIFEECFVMSTTN